MKTRHQFIRGFTLLELLIAISLFSILSVMAYSGLNTVLVTRESTDKISQRLTEVQLAYLRISNDIRQVVSRSIKDEFGTQIPVMRTSQSEVDTVEWTRMGYQNPQKHLRSNLQRVAYRLSENETSGYDLVRITWPVLDQAQGIESTESILITDVEEMAWGFLEQNPGADFLTSWPPVSATGLDSLPRAIDVTIKLKNLGTLRRLILLPRG